MPKAFRVSDTDPSIADAVSDHAICNQGVMPLRYPSANPVRAPLENHLQSLNGFLNVHIENLHALQNSLRPTADKKPVTPSKLSTAATVYPALTFITLVCSNTEATASIFRWQRKIPQRSHSTVQHACSHRTCNSFRNMLEH